jgi:hypothetical protein
MFNFVWFTAGLEIKDKNVLWFHGNGLQILLLIFQAHFQVVVQAISSQTRVEKIHANQIIESNYFTKSFPEAIKIFITKIKLWKTPHATVDHDRWYGLRVTSQAIDSIILNCILDK